MSRLRTHNKRAVRRQQRAVSWLWFTGRRTPKATFATLTWPTLDGSEILGLMRAQVAKWNSQSYHERSADFMALEREQRQVMGLGSGHLFIASSDGTYLKDDFGDRRFFPIPDPKAPQ